MKRLLFTLALVLFASSAFAQTLTIEYFAPGVNSQLPASLPIQSTVLAATVPVCNSVAPVVPATVVNPLRGFYDDVGNVGKVCLFTLASATIAAIPSGVGYTSTILYTDNLGQFSPRSAASNPFNRQAGPSAPTGWKVVQVLFDPRTVLSSVRSFVQPRKKGWMPPVPLAGARGHVIL